MNRPESLIATERAKASYWLRKAQRARQAGRADLARKYINYARAKRRSAAELGWKLP